MWIKRAEVRAAARTESLLHLLVCLQLETRSPRLVMIHTLMEGYVHSGWLCELEIGTDGSKSHEDEAIELFVDTGATEHVCGPYDFTHVALKKGPQPALKTATGELLKHHGVRTVDFRCQGQELRVGFTVVDVKRPILSTSRLMDRGIDTLIQTGKQSLRRFDGSTVELTRRGGLFFLQCQVIVPHLLAPVVDEPAGDAVDLPPADEELERELMAREEVAPPVAIEVPAPGEPTSGECADIIASRTCHISPGAMYVSELEGEKTDMSHDHRFSQAHLSSNATTAS